MKEEFEVGRTMSKKEARTLARNKAEYGDKLAKAKRDGVKISDLPKKQAPPKSNKRSG